MGLIGKSGAGTGRAPISRAASLVSTLARGSLPVAVGKARGMAESGRKSRHLVFLLALGVGLGAFAGLSPREVAAQESLVDLSNDVEERDPSSRSRNVGRAALETAGVLLGGTAWYWSDLDFNTRDWDLKWDWRSWKSKFTLESVRFDQNLFQTNAVSHSRAGWAHYTIARGNGFSAAESLATTVATSVLWEYLVEFKEMPSLNDMVVNTTAGFSIGEPFYQLGEFFLDSEPTLFSRTMAAALSPIAFFNDWVDGRKRPRRLTDGFGLSQEVSHQFALGAGIETRSFDGKDGRAGTNLGVGATLVTLPGYGRPGRISRFTKPGSWNSVEGELVIGQRGVTGGALRTRTTVVGHYAQNFSRDADGGITGHGLFVGLGSAFDYEDVGRPSGADYLATMNVIGPVVEVVARSGAFQFRWNSEIYGDFGMVRALAFENRLPPMTGDIYRPGEHDGTLPSVLGARGYYYALGMTAGTRLEVAYRGVEAGAEMRGDRYDSIEGFDRFREQLVDEVDLEDSRTISRAWVGLRPWRTGPRLATGIEWRSRRGKAGDVVIEHVDTRFSTSLSLVF